MRPVIGVSCNKRQWTGELSLRNEYITMIIQSGGLPFLIPINQQEEIFKESLFLCDGLLLTGGGDIAPDFYRQERKLTGTRGIDRERDQYEFGLVSAALELKKPILGICRGMQIINVFFQGSLFQDIGMEMPNSGAHQPDQMTPEVFHEVFLRDNTKIGKFLGGKIIANSFHHQSVKDPGDGLIVSGISPDGVVESIENCGEPWIIGVQWHPERLGWMDSMQSLFKEFVEISKHVLSGTLPLDQPNKTMLS